MKPISLLLLWLLATNSCSPPQKEVKNQTTHPAQLDVLPSPKETSPNPPKTALVDVPSTALQNFVAQLATNQWVPDTSRLKKVPIYGELDRSKVSFFNGHPFYPIAFEESRLQSSRKLGAFNTSIEEADLAFFERVRTIWGYFYRDKEATGMVSDGVIEQWEFETKEEAAQALKKIQTPGPIIYFNTQPYFCSLDNKLYIFQTRASAFSYKQEAVFEEFVKANTTQLK